MPPLGRVLFQLCVAIAALVGAGTMFHSNPQVQTGGLAILGGMVALGLLLRWIFSGGAED